MSDYTEQKEKPIRLMCEFKARFEENRGSTQCADLLGHDISNPAIYKHVLKNEIFMNVCPGVVDDAIQILEGIISENK